MEFKHYRHRRKRKRTALQQSRFEQFLTSRLFTLLGILFLLFAFFSLLPSGEGSNSFYNLLMKLFAPADGPIVAVTGSGLPELLLYFVPALLALTILFFFVKRHPQITYPISLLLALYLVVIQVKISFFNVYFGGCFYADFAMAFLFMAVTTFLLLLTALLNRKSPLLILTGFFLYTSIILYIYNYGTYFEFLFSGIIIFSIVAAWISRKIEQPAIQWVSPAFAWAFMGLFWLRKFVVNAKPEFLPLFFIFGILFYLLFYAVVVFASEKREHPIPKWMQLLVTWANLLVFLGTTSFVIYKYYDFSYVWILVTALLGFNILGLYLIKRYKSPVCPLPHYFVVMLLGSLVLPLVLRQNMVILFTAAGSVLMLAYANKFKERSSFWISIVTIAVMIVFYFISWIRIYIPELFAELTIPEGALMVHGIVGGVAVVLSLIITQGLLLTAELPLSKKWFRKLEYSRLIRLFLLFSLFLTMGWTGFSIASFLTDTLTYSPLGWFIGGSLYFIGMISFYRGRQSSFKRPVLYLAALFTLLYPVLVHLNMAIYRDKLLLMHDVNIPVLLMHYLALGLTIISVKMIIKRIYRHKVKNIPLLRLVAMGTMFFILFLICTEYDNLSVFIATIQSGPVIKTGAGSDLLSANKYLPWSILIWIVTTWVFFRSVYRKDLFLRNFAVVIFIGLLVKIFVFDFIMLSEGGRSTVFLLMGLFLIGFAFTYPRVLKGEPVVPEISRPRSKKE